MRQTGAARMGLTVGVHPFQPSGTKVSCKPVRHAGPSHKLVQLVKETERRMVEQYGAAGLWEHDLAGQGHGGWQEAVRPLPRSSVAFGASDDGFPVRVVNVLASAMKHALLRR